MNFSKIIRPAQAARLLGISRATLYRWEASGRLAPRVILGPNTSGWREEDLAAFIASAPRGTKSESLFKEETVDAREEVTDTSNAGRAGEMATGSRERKPESGNVGEERTGTGISSGPANTRTSRSGQKDEHGREEIKVRVTKRPLELVFDSEDERPFTLSADDLARESGVDYQRVMRLKQKGLLSGMFIAADNGRLFFKREAVQVVKDAPINLPGRPPGTKRKMNFTERAQAAKVKAEERRKILNVSSTYSVLPEKISEEPDQTPLSRVGCVTIGDKDFVLAARKDTEEEKPDYYLFDESQTDMLGNRVARPVGEGELKIADVVQLIGTLFTTVENQFAVDRAIMGSGKENLRMVSELLDVGTYAAPSDLLREAQGWTPPPSQWADPSTAEEGRFYLVWRVCGDEEPFDNGIAELLYKSGDSWFDFNGKQAGNSQVRAITKTPGPNLGLHWLYTEDGKEIMR